MINQTKIYISKIKILKFYLVLSRFNKIHISVIQQIINNMIITVKMFANNYLLCRPTPEKNWFRY